MTCDPVKYSMSVLVLVVQTQSGSRFSDCMIHLEDLEDLENINKSQQYKIV